MALAPCPNCNKRISTEAETCPKCGHKLSRAEWDSLLTTRRERARKGGIFMAIGILAIIAFGAMSASQDQSPGLTKTRNVFSSPGIDHAAEMALCKDEIGKLVQSIIWWRWDDLSTFDQRRIRRAEIRYISKEGIISQDRIVCSFDEPPVGNDFFISS